MAISLVEAIDGGGGGPPSSVALTITVPIGDVIVAANILGSDPGSGTPTGADVTVSDNVNSGNYALLGYTYDATNTVFLSWHWKIANASGIPTVSTTNTESAFGNLLIQHYNGFVGTPTADVAIVASAKGASSNPTISPIVTNFANELLLVSYKGAMGANSMSAPWVDPAGQQKSWYAIEASAASSAPFVNGATPTYWDLLLVGIYDAAGAASEAPVNSNGHPLISHGAPLISLAPLAWIIERRRRLMKT